MRMPVKFASTLLVVLARAWPQAAVIPDTQLRSLWDQVIAFRDQTGGFELLGIDKGERQHIAALPSASRSWR
jgi:hypothetical protein